MRSFRSSAPRGSSRSRTFGSFQVQRTERLVQQQHVRLVPQGAGNGHPLLLAAGQLGHAAFAVTFQIDQGKHPVDLLLNDILAGFLDPQAEGNVFINVQVGEERVALEYGIDLPLVRRHVVNALAVKDDGALVLLQKSAQDAQQRGLSAAGRAQQGHKFIFKNVQVHALEDDLPVKVLDDIPEFNELSHGRLSFSEAITFLFYTQLAVSTIYM